MKSPLKMTNYSKAYPNLREHENLKLNLRVKIVNFHGCGLISKSNFNKNYLNPNSNLTTNSN